MISNSALNLNTRLTCVFLQLRVLLSTTRSKTLDASKAFDRVNYWSLFQKLIDRKAPLLLVRVLVFWYNMQKVCIKWGSTTSSYFSISNGVRQSGIVSPKLFSLYMDGLTDKLMSHYVGCYFDDKCINHVMYADHICLLAPPSKHFHPDRIRIEYHISDMLSRHWLNIRCQNSVKVNTFLYLNSLDMSSTTFMKAQQCRVRIESDCRVRIEYDISPTNGWTLT
jgi:hypothetical protein